VYADYCEGWIRTLVLGANGSATDPRELPLGKVGSITSFGTDAAGELYVVVQEGTVFRIEPS